jgi:hypothetical protein
MKNIFILLAIFVISLNSVFAGKRSIIYVAAITGLSLRTEPSAKSERIELLPYGTKITTYNYTQEYETIDGLSGYWLRIALNGQDGYIFSGYTIPVPPPQKNTANLDAYLEEVFGKPLATDSARNEENKVVLTTSIYNNCVTSNFSFVYEYGDLAFQYSILNLDLSAQEAFVLFSLMEENIIGGIFGKEDRPKYASYNSEDTRTPLKLSVQGTKTKDWEVLMNAWFEIKIGFLGNSRVYRRLRIFRTHEKTSITWGMYATSDCD